ncbi:hypothetical protein KIM372_07670 [Bombiscardovia nodaiensis]|uniref:Flavodoxin-like fold domain-containing protein n=1 Tax=Bombiscardovia nodaiensis TaxID=2932181 RepID=A0ABM8B857_9BIFI|nr:hypothetical protein KIM372_07670 [Bombiscardovia nodaiensis]
MKAVAITANPDPESLTLAVGNAFLNGAAEGGALTDLIDLYAEGFDPTYTMEDRLHYSEQGPLPQDVAALQDRIADADVLTFVFPMYWFGMPAMMKGFFDRVLCRRFAYHADGTEGALAGKKVRLLILCGGREDDFRRNGVNDAVETQICQRTLTDYCAITDIEKMYIDGLGNGEDADEESAQDIRQRLVHVSLMGRQLALEGGSGEDGARG